MMVGMIVDIGMVIGVVLVWFVIDLVMCGWCYVGIDFDLVMFDEGCLCIYEFGFDDMIEMCVGDVFVLLFDDGMLMMVVGCVMLYYLLNKVFSLIEMYCVLVLGGIVFVYDMCCDVL